MYPRFSQSIYSYISRRPDGPPEPTQILFLTDSIDNSVSINRLSAPLNASLVSNYIFTDTCLDSNSSLILISNGNKVFENSRKPNLPSWSESYLLKSNSISPGLN